MYGSDPSDCDIVLVNVGLFWLSEMALRPPPLTEEHVSGPFVAAVVGFHAMVAAFVFRY